MLTLPFYGYTIKSITQNGVPIMAKITTRLSDKEIKAAKQQSQKRKNICSLMVTDYV